MDEKLVHYIEIVHRSRELLRPEILPEDGRGKTMEKLLRNRDEQRVLMREGRAILSDRSLGFGVAPKELSDKQAAELTEFADALSRFADQVDNPLSYRVNTMLRERALARNDLPALLRADYFCGLTLYYLNRTLQEGLLNGYAAQITAYFSEAAAYLPKLGEFDATARGFILRSQANIRLANNIQRPDEDQRFNYQPVSIEREIEMLKEDFEIFGSPVYQALAPEFKWDNAIYVLHLGVTTLLTELRQENDPEIAEMVYQSAKVIYENAQEISKLRNRLVSGRSAYVWEAAQFHTGRITLEEMLDALEGYSNRPSDKPFDSDDVYQKVMIPLYFLEYAGRYGGESEQLAARCKKTRRQVLEYVMNMPHSDGFSVLVTLFNNLRLLFDNRGDTEDRVLDVLLSFDKPLCAHSMMTGRLAWALLELLIDQSPETFAEEYRTPAMLQRGRDRLRWRVYRNAMYHDFGKVSLLDQLAPYTRDLTAEELVVRQSHPYLGYHQLKSFDQTQDYAEAALGHELFFDGKGGYPDYAKRQSGTEQILMDVVAVADSLDTLTDPVAAVRTVELPLEAAAARVIGEAGTRFAPYVTKLLEKPENLATLARVMDEERLETYYFVYHREAERGV